MNSTDREFPQATRFDQLTPEVMLQVNRVCDQFELSWSSHPPASFQEYLRTIPDDLRPIALPELVTIDLEFRIRQSRSIELDLYRQTCPELETPWLEMQLAKARARHVGDSAEQSLTGRQLGDYEIQELLGSGGMGRVYKGVHRRMGRVVALKIMRTAIRHLPSAQLRFEREVRAAARLNHPNIVSAYDAREDDGILYLVSEYIDGQDLSRRVKEHGPLAIRPALFYALQAAQGLRYAHAQGLIHRDLKPSNLLVDRKGQVKLLDLGLARLTAGAEDSEHDESLTHSNQILGTAQYMAPEQARSPLSADPRSDIYSLGCTLFFLLTGEPPYSGRTQFETLLAHSKDPIPRIRNTAAGQNLPFELDEFLVRMMAKDPRQRPPDVRAVIKRLKPIYESLDEELPSAKSVAPPSESQPAPSPIPADRFAPLAEPLSTLQGPVWRLAKSHQRSVRRSGNGPRNQRRIIGAGLAALGILIASAWSFWPERIPPSVESEGLPPETKLDQKAASPVPRDRLPADSPVNPRSNELETAGWVFNGQSSYIEVPGFEVAPEGQLLIEVAATPGPQRGPANLVTWAGDKALTLFRDSDQHWGIAYFDGLRSILRTTEQRIAIHSEVLVAGRWDGSALHILINGQEVPTVSISYSLFPSPQPILLIGGVPAGFLPAGQGTRWFAGEIRAVRLSKTELPVPARSFQELVQNHSGTVALFRLDSPVQSPVRDSSSHAWAGQVHDIREPR